MKINIKNIRIKSICATLFISLFLSCNNGIEELEKRNSFLSSLANLGNDFLSVFTSFGDSFGGVLGFNKDTKKSEVGDYFKNIQKTVEGVKSKLNKIIENMKREENPNTAATETAVTTLNEKLTKIIEGAKTASEAIDGASELLGNIETGNSNKSGAVGTGVANLVNGIKTIVDVVLGDKGKSDAGDNKKADALNARNGDGADKLFDGSAGASSNDKQVAADAAKAVGAVTGADILQAMAKNPDSAKLANNTGAISSGVVSNAKDGTIAGAIALRAMAKGGKFANGTTTGNDVAVAVKGAAVSAVNKALDTLAIAIRKTIDEGLQEVKVVMKINSNDTPVTTDSKNQ
ncbi:variable large family protein (plasmid) [Borrelia coriaceae]|uniref:variable large family protein n=1 Tax=Borrelia coriaceae TaxID=144 RepID=UPI0004B080DC|nr:variable large family protein [Borrelia coriaceae]UPA17533.1 variable large family protein [Borrelia coriaceae]